jgi:uncharacterized protein YyaL (SSP411 family)
MPNRLAAETSPYLLQHAGNPVDWYPWGTEALGRARDEEKPIFLSIGYSACHWCHVMEHESFESAGIAGRLNANFISIKVDREERPDLDHLYMQAVQLLTGRGGWPMSVFLTPDGKPFFGGTYWPPTRKMGMPGFDEVLDAVVDAWRNRRENALAQADNLTAHLAASEVFEPDGEVPSRDVIHRAEAALSRAFDPIHGGFGAAPKFPHPMDLRLLMRIHARSGREETLEMVARTLEKMAAGGIHDHLGGGFHRYSVDERWLVPHFEKMLYDNALLGTCYVEAYQLTKAPEFADVARGICDYVLRDMRDPAGGFHGTEDADSEGEEGKYYVWSWDEVQAILGDGAARFAYVYDVSPEGNFEERNILNLPKTIAQAAQIKGWDVRELRDELADGRRKLLEARKHRVRPGKDDKIIVSWNGLMIETLALCGVILDEPRYLDAARQAAAFIATTMRDSSGRLLHSWRSGAAKALAYLDDHAYLANGLLELYQATFEQRWLEEAARLGEEMLRLFWDDAAGDFYFTGSDQEQLVARRCDIQDGSVPSSSAMAATTFLKLGRLTGKAKFSSVAERVLNTNAPLMRRAPTAAGQWLLALDSLLGPTREIVLIAENGEDLAKSLLAARRRFAGATIFAGRVDGRNDSLVAAELLQGRSALKGQPTMYVCEGYVCGEPLVGLAAITRWSEARAAKENS